MGKHLQLLAVALLAAMPALAHGGAGSAQPGKDHGELGGTVEPNPNTGLKGPGDGVTIHTPVDRVAIFDCARFNPEHDTGIGYVNALLAAFVLDQNETVPAIGAWDCNYSQQAHAIICSPTRGRLHSYGGARRVTLEFQVRGNCASFRFPGRSAQMRGAGIYAVTLRRGAELVWQIRTNRQRPLESWASSFPVTMPPLANRLGQ